MKTVSKGENMDNFTTRDTSYLHFTLVQIQNISKFTLFEFRVKEAAGAIDGVQNA